MSKSLIIVESPTKAVTLSKFLDKDYTVIATKGHIEDLPKSKFGIDVDNHFAPEYTILKDKEKLLKEIQKGVNNADDVYIATDPDREGEAIGWHLLQNLKLDNKKVLRITFHEITKNALLEALKNAHDLNYDLVNSQVARRVLDRVVGYKLSPLLWEKIRYGLSAGRVQSAALKLIVDREKEIQAFQTNEYWNITSDFNINSIVITFNLNKLNSKKIQINNEDEANNILKDISSGKSHLKEIKNTQIKNNPKPPYTTSTLQQDANLKIGFSSKKTMMIAQMLYEGLDINGENVGLITYMRTDSVSLSDNSINEIRSFVSKEYPKEYLPNSKNVYKVKTKLAQEAHEAIRPSDISKIPDKIKKYLTPDQYKLYKLIWSRAIASQMNPAIYNNKKLLLDVKLEKEKKIYDFSSNFSDLAFDGYKIIYNDDNKKENDNIIKFPFNVLSEIKSVLFIKSDKSQHFTEPPARYNDASLIKKCEESGIGRPSTYSSIISTLINRTYIERKERHFIPTDTGMVVSDFLEKYFSNIVDINFTSNMEDDLDKVASGKLNWEKVVSDFYYPFDKDILKKEKTIEKSDVTNLGKSDEKCPECGSDMFIKLGRYGKFLSCSRYPDCKGMKSMVEIEVQEVDEKCPECGSELVLKKGRFGDFFACSRYPDCKYTKSLKNKEKKILELSCPDCGEGKIVELRNKRGQIFYGCSNYPKCHFTSNNLDKIKS